MIGTILEKLAAINPVVALTFSTGVLLIAGGTWFGSLETRVSNNQTAILAAMNHRVRIFNELNSVHQELKILNRQVGESTGKLDALMFMYQTEKQKREAKVQ